MDGLADDDIVAAEDEVDKNVAEEDANDIAEDDEVDRPIDEEGNKDARRLACSSVGFPNFVHKE